MRVTYQNTQVDGTIYKWTQEVIGSLSSKWTNLLPGSLNIAVEVRSFAKVRELREYCSTQNIKKADWSYISCICSEIDSKKAGIWVRRGEGIDYYYFKKSLYALLAKIMWTNSTKLRKVVVNCATGMAAQNEQFAYEAFRDSFSRLILNPDYLRDKKPAAWSFICNVQEAI